MAPLAIVEGAWTLVIETWRIIEIVAADESLGGKLLSP